MIFLLVPETKQRTLEELDYVCELVLVVLFGPGLITAAVAVPTTKHASYHLTQSMPYFFKRWVFGNKNAKLQPLYHFEGHLDSDLYKSK
jgi:hypothetical protein